MFSFLLFAFQEIRINTCISILTDSDIPISTTGTHNAGEVEDPEGQHAQSHSAFPLEGNVNFGAHNWRCNASISFSKI